MAKTLLTFLISVLLLTTHSALARTIVVAQDPTWPPMEFLNEAGEIVGFDTDFMKAVGREAGFEVTFEKVPWDKIFSGLENGRYDAVCSAVTITEERRKVMDFSLPYFWDRKVNQALVVRKGEPWKLLEEMKGKKVGAQEGTTGFSAIKRAESLIVRPYGQIGLAIQDLLSGLVDGVVCDDPVASKLLSQNGEWADRLEVATMLKTGDEYYGVAVKKGNREVLNLINKGIEAVQAKGIDIELRKKWMGNGGG